MLIKFCDRIYSGKYGTHVPNHKKQYMKEYPLHNIYLRKCIFHTCTIYCCHLNKCGIDCSQYRIYHDYNKVNKTCGKEWKLYFWHQFHLIPKIKSPSFFAWIFSLWINILHDSFYWKIWRNYEIAYSVYWLMMVYHYTYRLTVYFTTPCPSK